MRPIRAEDKQHNRRDRQTEIARSRIDLVLIWDRHELLVDQVDRETDRQRDGDRRQTDGQTNKQTDKQTDRERQTEPPDGTSCTGRERVGGLHRQVNIWSPTFPLRNRLLH